MVYMKTLTYRVIIQPDGKQFHAYVPALSGCHTFGKTIQEAQKNINEAIQLYVESLNALGEPVPVDSSYESFETIDVKALKNPVYA